MKSHSSKLHFGVLKIPFFYVSFTPGKISTLLVSLAIVLISVVTVPAQTRLGLHFTQQELNIWRTRANVGPYKHRGYSSVNSFDDWDRIQSNANAFLSNPGAERWKGIATSSCVQKFAAPEPLQQGKKLRDAAFAYLITGNINYRNAVRNELIAQTSEPYTDFSVRSRWCDGGLNDMAPAFPIASWLTRLLFAYDYIKSTLPDTDKQRLDKWFYNAALYFQRNVDIYLDRNYNNRSGEDYTLSAHAYYVNSALGRTTHYGGNKTSGLARHYNNRRSAQVKFFTLVGIHQNNGSLKQSGKRFVKELLIHSTYPDGTIGEYERWSETMPDMGWSYSAHIIADAADIADHFARAGDTDLYRFTTSAGDFGTRGGTKNLALIINSLLNVMDGTVKRYGTAYSSNLNNNYLIDGIHGGWHSVYDTWFAQSNIYFKNNKTRGLYTRTGANTKPYPYVPASSGIHYPFGGSWDSYPGVKFMFGEMENKVWPYINTSNPTSLTPEPSNNNTITINAYGPNSPKFRVVVNGVITGDATAGSSLQALKFTTKLSVADIKTVMIHYYNDAFGRDLFVNSIVVGNQTISSTASSVKYDKYHIDGNDVVPGTVKLEYYGALIFKPSGSGTDVTQPQPTEPVVTNPTPVPGTSNSIIIKAYSTPLAGVYAHFNVIVNGTKIGEATTTSSLRDYNFTTAIPLKSGDKIIVHYDNDAFSSTQDRNLYINSMVVNGLSIASTSSAVVFDRYALDGNDVLAGRVDLRWPGFLIFNMPSNITNNTARQDFEGTVVVDAELPKITDFLIAPNPNAGSFNLALELNPASNAEAIEVVIVDVVGNTVYQKNYSGLTERLDERIELPHIPSGMYLLKVKAGDEISVKRFIKQ